MSAPPPYQPPMAPPPKKKGRGCLIAAIVALVVVVASIGGCVAIMGSVGNEMDKQQKTEHTVVFKATTKGKANVTYGKMGGSSQKEITADWTEEVKITGWDAMSLMVSSTDFEKPGEVTCEIIVDGKSVVKNSGSGQGANATCSASSLPS